jgi:iron complex transport system permease protein
MSVLVGSADLSPITVFASIGSHLGLPVTAPPPLLDSVVWNLRLPRVLMAATVGAALAVCGCVLQAVTGNALADPYLLGISSGASTGAVAVFVLGVGGGAISLSAGAFAGALTALAFVIVLLGRRGANTTRIVLIGVVVGQLFSALTSLIVTAAGDAQSARGVMYWLLGSMASARWESLGVTSAAVVAAVVAIWARSLDLDGFAFGPDAAAALGIRVDVARRVLLIVSALMTAAVVAAVGSIGFVGLIVPHAVRMLGAATHRSLLPLSALAGAVFLVWADTAARWMFSPQEIPVGVVTALLGVPAFLFIAQRRAA